MTKYQIYQLHEERLPQSVFLDSLGCLRTWKKTRSDMTYMNVSCSFDIETTSFYFNKDTGKTIATRFEIPKKQLKKCWEKRAIMYAWVFTLNGFVTTGRTWDEFDSLLNALRLKYGLCENLILPIYVHNLSYETAFIARRLHFTDVFALSEREPLYMRTDDGIEFRDSLSLSGYSLETTGENLKKYKILKMTGDLDYSKMRNSMTELTEKEWGYIVNDGLVVSAYIQEQIEEYRSVTNIPMTKTGVVRRYLRKCCFYGNGNHRKDYSHKREKYRSLMDMLTLETGEYKLARRAYAGGIVHASAINEGIIFEDVTSMDFTSSYPYCLIAFKYPMSKGERYAPKDYGDFLYIQTIRLAIFDIEFTGLQSRYSFEHLISSSKCPILEDAVVDNGRVVSASRCVTSMTSIDFKYISKMYTWQSVRIGKMYVYKQRFLPTDFIKAVIELYKTKTTLKDVDDELSKARYQWAKEQLNSIYGCLVMDVCRPTIKWNGKEWSRELPDIDDELAKYNKDQKRFSSYLWGVFCTSYARYNLVTGIFHAGNDGDSIDYLYCDTDSVKLKNLEKHMDYFDSYNENVSKRLKMVCKHHGLPFDDVAPKTIEGKTKMLGVWDKEYTAKRFVALRAKCYAYETEKHGFNITIAGVNKKIAVPKLIEKAKKNKKDPFDYIHFGFSFDVDTCGKNLHTYIDKEIKGTLKDFQGHTARYHELSCVHLEPTTFDLNAPEIYLEFLKNAKERGIIA